MVKYRQASKKKEKKKVLLVSKRYLKNVLSSVLSTLQIFLSPQKKCQIYM